MTRDRFALAAEIIGRKSSKKILEIGCGSGLLIAELLKQKSVKHIVGIDQSASAITAAKQKFPDELASGRLLLQHTALAKFKADITVDTIAAFNVNVFVKGSDADFNMIHHLLPKSGRLYVFYQFPHTIDKRAADPIIKHLTIHELEVDENFQVEADKFPFVCVIARARR